MQEKDFLSVSGRLKFYNCGQFTVFTSSASRQCAQIFWTMGQSKVKAGSVATSSETWMLTSQWGILETGKNVGHLEDFGTTLILNLYYNYIIIYSYDIV